jgi:hypothetical protein
MGKFKQLLVWRCEFETLEQARKEIATFIDNYHHRRHTGLRIAQAEALATEAKFHAVRPDRIQ